MISKCLNRHVFVCGLVLFLAVAGVVELEPGTLEVCCSLGVLAGVFLAGRERGFI